MRNSRCKLLLLPQRVGGKRDLSASCIAKEQLFPSGDCESYAVKDHKIDEALKEAVYTPHHIRMAQMAERLDCNTAEVTKGIGMIGAAQVDIGGDGLFARVAKLVADVRSFLGVAWVVEVISERFHFSCRCRNKERLRCMRRAGADHEHSTYTRWY